MFLFEKQNADNEHIALANSSSTLSLKIEPLNIYLNSSIDKNCLSIIIDKYSTGKEERTGDIYLIEAIRLLSYTIGEVKSGYTMRLDCDGNSDLIDIFDKYKNLLNIFPTIEN